MSLDRFIIAQSDIWSCVEKELTNGKKINHWMWFIFPQFVGLGTSVNSIYYSIKDIPEAIAYSEDIVLGSRLRHLCYILLDHKNLSAIEIFGDVDAEKLRSCLTLFSQVDPKQKIYKECLIRFFKEPDQLTLSLLLVENYNAAQ